MVTPYMGRGRPRTYPPGIFPTISIMPVRLPRTTKDFMNNGVLDIDYQYRVTICILLIA